ncbi:hypothetical protein [Heliorestis convoluta]|uniref:Uncharacterized protein n=1 Tax=Heliorestis convoluta TaxID=356322 RepID=A0A5Q2N610_9FIRM|nr:hypothetical protein [Heliorestis convoluta]QGG48005.1 hypothetical protein FTV88_1907 [Heliorestis convoluta]
MINELQRKLDENVRLEFKNKMEEFLFEYINVQSKQDELRDILRKKAEFYRKFPRESLCSMTVEQYAYFERNSFIYWVVFELEKLGSTRSLFIDARNFTVVYNRNQQKYIYNQRFASLDDAWNKLRNDIIELIDVCDGNTLRALSSNNLLSNKYLLKGKIAYLYHPKKFLPIYNRAHLLYFLYELGIISSRNESDSPFSLPGTGSLRLNLLLKNIIYEIGRDGWNDPKVSDLWNSNYNFLIGIFLYKIMSPPRMR